MCLYVSCHVHEAREKEREREGETRVTWVQRRSVRSEQERAGARKEGRKVNQEESVEHGKIGYTKRLKEEERANKSDQ